MLEDDSECLRTSSTPSLASLPVHKNRKTGSHFGIYREKIVPEYLVPKKPNVNLHHSRIVILTIMATGIVLVICLTLLDFAMTQTKSVPVIHYARYRLDRTPEQNSKENVTIRQQNWVQTSTESSSDVILYSPVLDVRKPNNAECLHCNFGRNEETKDLFTGNNRIKRISEKSDDSQYESEGFTVGYFQSKRISRDQERSQNDGTRFSSVVDYRGKRFPSNNIRIHDEEKESSTDSPQNESVEKVIEPQEGKETVQTISNRQGRFLDETESQKEQALEEISDIFEMTTDSTTDAIPFHDEEFSSMSDEESKKSQALRYVYVKPKKHETEIPDFNPQPQESRTVAPKNHRRFSARQRSRPMTQSYAKKRESNLVPSRKDARALSAQSPATEMEDPSPSQNQKPQSMSLVSPQSIAFERGGVFVDDSVPFPAEPETPSRQALQRRISFADFEEYPQLSNYKNLDHVKSVMDIIQYLNTETPYGDSNQATTVSPTSGKRQPTKERHRQRTNNRVAAKRPEFANDDPYAAVESSEKEFAYNFESSKNNQPAEIFESDSANTDPQLHVLPDDVRPSRILDSRAQYPVPNFVERFDKIDNVKNTSKHSEHKLGYNQGSGDNTRMSDDRSKGINERDINYPAIDRINSEYGMSHSQNNVNDLLESKNVTNHGQLEHRSSTKDLNLGHRHDKPPKINYNAQNPSMEPTLFLPNFYGSDSASYYAANPSSFHYDASGYPETSTTNPPGFRNYNDIYNAFKPSDLADINNMIPAAMLDEDYPPPPARPEIIDAIDPFLTPPAKFMDYIPNHQNPKSNGVYTTAVFRKFGNGVEAQNPPRVNLTTIAKLIVDDLHKKDLQFQSNGSHVWDTAEESLLVGQGSQAVAKYLPAPQNEIPIGEMKDHLVPPRPDEKSVYAQEADVQSPWHPNFSARSIAASSNQAKSSSNVHHPEKQLQPDPQVKEAGRPVRGSGNRSSASGSSFHARRENRRSSGRRSKKRNRIRYQNPPHVPPPPTALALTNSTQPDDKVKLEKSDNQGSTDVVQESTTTLETISPDMTNTRSENPDKGSNGDDTKTESYKKDTHE